MSQRPAVKAPFRLRSDLGRRVTHGFSCPLGVYPVESHVELREGYEARFLLGDDQYDDQCEYRLLVSNERMLEAVRQLLAALLPDEVYALYEEFSYDAYRETDAFRSGEPVAKERLLQAWDTYGEYFVEDGKSGFGAASEEPSVEIFVEEHGALTIACGLELRAPVEELIEAFGLREISDIRGIDNYEHQHRDILELEWNGEPMMDDHDIKFSVVESLGMHLVNRDEGTPHQLPTPYWIHLELDLSFVHEVEQPRALVSFGLTAETYDEALRLAEESVLERFPNALIGRVFQIYRMRQDEIGEEIAPSQRGLIAQAGIWYSSDAEYFA